jgi:hypothetical protein
MIIPPEKDLAKLTHVWSVKLSLGVFPDEKLFHDSWRVFSSTLNIRAKAGTPLSFEPSMKTGVHSRFQPPGPYKGHGQSLIQDIVGRVGHPILSLPHAPQERHGSPVILVPLVDEADEDASVDENAQILRLRAGPP